MFTYATHFCFSPKALLNSPLHPHRTVPRTSGHRRSPYTCAFEECEATTLRSSSARRSFFERVERVFTYATHFCFSPKALLNSPLHPHRTVPRTSGHRRSPYTCAFEECEATTLRSSSARRSFVGASLNVLEECSPIRNTFFSAQRPPSTVHFTLTELFSHHHTVDRYLTGCF